MEKPKEEEGRTMDSKSPCCPIQQKDPPVGTEVEDERRAVEKRSPEEVLRLEPQQLERH